jgi:hypothetical protein
VPAIVIHIFVVVILSRVIFVVPDQQNVLIKLDKPDCQLLQNCSRCDANATIFVRQIFQSESNQVLEGEGVIDFLGLKRVAEVN